MVKLADECQECFGTRDLYAVLEVDKQTDDANCKLLKFYVYRRLNYIIQ